MSVKTNLKILKLKSIEVHYWVGTTGNTKHAKDLRGVARLMRRNRDNYYGPTMTPIFEDGRHKSEVWEIWCPPEFLEYPYIPENADMLGELPNGERVAIYRVY